MRNSTENRYKQNRIRCKGFSILEALVSFVVMGIAIAGITELIWANTSWLSTLQNKFDSYYASKRFLKMIEIDLHQTVSIDSSSDSKTLILSRADESNFDSYGFLTYSSPFVYKVESDTEPGSEGQYVIKAGPSLSDLRTVLRGVVGPLSITTGQPVIFQYIERRGGDLQSTAASSNPSEPINISSVLIDIELKRSDFGKSNQDGPNKSGIVLRDEVFLRNSSIHAQ